MNGADIAMQHNSNSLQNMYLNNEERAHLHATQAYRKEQLSFRPTDCQKT